MKKLVKTLKINKTFGLTGKIEIDEKTCQNVENKQSFGLTGKNEKLKLMKKTRQNAENKQTFGLTR